MSLIMQQAKEHSATWVQKGEVEFLSAVSDLTFAIITKIIFGQDIKLD